MFVEERMYTLHPGKAPEYLKLYTEVPGGFGPESGLPVWFSEGIAVLSSGYVPMYMA
jgi:hypothetical protein